MVNGTGTICVFEVTGLSTGTSPFTIVPGKIYSIDADAVEEQAIENTAK